MNRADVTDRDDPRIVQRGPCRVTRASKASSSPRSANRSRIRESVQPTIFPRSIRRPTWQVGEGSRPRAMGSLSESEDHAFVRYCIRKGRTDRLHTLFHGGAKKENQASSRVESPSAT